MSQQTDTVPGQETKTITDGVSKDVEIAKSTLQQASEEDSLDTEQVVVFKLANEEYAVPILDVQEIIPTSDITAFPNSPDYVKGIISVRGTVATIISMIDRFGLTRTGDGIKDQYIVLTNVANALFGIMVDEVSSVTKIPRSSIKEAAGTMKSNIHANYIEGIAVMQERVILILDLRKILEEDDLKGIAQQAEALDVN